MKTVIAYIGLGLMGLPMAKRLISLGGGHSELDSTALIKLYDQRQARRALHT